MFNNPLRKYQSGSEAPSEQERQQVMAAFQSVADKLQIPVENLVQKIQDAPDENERKGRIEAIARASQGDESAFKIIASWFTQSAKLGGKIRDFICKHAKGGALIADCGCKSVPKAQNGTSGIPQNSAALDMYLMSNMQMPNSSNLFTGQQVANLINSIHLNQPLVQAQEDGGKVENAQEGTSGLELRPTQRKPNTTDIPWHVRLRGYLGLRPAKDVGNAKGRWTSSINSGRNKYLLETATVNGTSADTWGVITPETNFHPADTVIVQTVNGRPNNLSTDQERTVKNRLATIKENGGVVKGQGGIPEGVPSPGNVSLFGKVTPHEHPVSTQPLDSAKVRLNNGNLIFTDINGNNVTWGDLGNGNWSYRNGNDIMNFSTSQKEGFKPYGKFNAWNMATSGSTKLSEKDNNDLKNLKNKTKNKK